ncbi:unnamed protein product [Trifolium pratense]|uniref:Uncharacterized protein n=1 Tax=Trifolium pratense TaxID=57577 RepID=A0ACB0JA48_TRIPR|nr:unnamed protein product [Trifolium pratense]
MEPFCDLYPALFIKTVHQNATISTMGTWDNNIWSWKLDWTDLLTETETVAAAELFLLLEQVQPCRNIADRRRWIPNTAGIFSVQSAYAVLLKRVNLVEIEPKTLSALKDLWNNNVPTKVSIFGWRLLLDKLPTRETLFNRGGWTETAYLLKISLNILFCLETLQEVNLAKDSDMLFG